MALYAFDGTWNENQPDDPKDTNVVKFTDAYQGEKFYVEGVGTRLGFLGRFFGGVFGAGGKKRVKEAYKALEENFRNRDEVIDIIGFSRGSALALDFSNTIHAKGVLGKKQPPIRFVGVWDVVPSIGIPGNDINLGYVLTLPDSVQKCYHAMALDERRHNFKVQRVVTTMPDADAEGRVYEVWLRGVHSDVGGGNRNIGLSSIALYWMCKRAIAHGVPIPDSMLEDQKQNRKAEAPISTNLDPIKNPYRPVPFMDVVHHSVTYREGANNPPIGLQVVDDEGKILDEPFGKVRASDESREGLLVT